MITKMMFKCLRKLHLRYKGFVAVIATIAVCLMASRRLRSRRLANHIYFISWMHYGTDSIQDPLMPCGGSELVCTCINIIYLFICSCLTLLIVCFFCLPHSAWVIGVVGRIHIVRSRNNKKNSSTITFLGLLFCHFNEVLWCKYNPILHSSSSIQINYRFQWWGTQSLWKRL